MLFLVGASVVAATAATGSAAVTGLKAAVVFGAIGAVVGAGTSAVSHRGSTGSWDGAGKATIDGAVNGFASGFMTGGIMAGGSQIISSRFKVAAKVSVNAGKKVSSGIKIGKKIKVLSPDKLYHNSNGGTLFKIGKTFRIDVNSNTMLHAHCPGPFANTHFPIGIIGAGIYGGVRK